MYFVLQFVITEITFNVPCAVISSVWSRLYAPVIRTALLGKVRGKNTAWSMRELSGFNPFTAMLVEPSF